MSREIDIQNIRSRPRFKIKTNLTKQEFLKRLNRQFTMQNKVLGGFVGEEVSVIRMRKDKHKYWAPQLHLRLEKDDDDKDIIWIRGLFGPKSAVWTFFIFLYILGGTLFSFFAMIWFVQWRLNVSSNLIIWAWIGLGIMIGTYLAAKIGQNFAKEHMQILKDFMEKVVNDELEND